jgi:plasmid replication initiation protein
MEAEQMSMSLDDSNLVVQSNSLIYGKYDMSSLEQKLILTIISVIKKNDESIKTFNLKVQELAELLCVSPELLYRDLQKVCKSIMEKIVEVQHPNGNWEMFNIINYAKYNKRQGSVTLEINKRAEPYLIKLQELFTSYELINILNLESKYSIRLYQIMKGALYKKELTYLLQDFKDTLKINKKTYEAYNNINRFILTPCLEEINLKTDIIVSYIPIKDGRKVTGLKFTIKSKSVVTDKKTSKKEKTLQRASKFDNFEAREYDYDKLEQGLLGYEEIAIEDVTK